MTKTEDYIAKEAEEINERGKLFALLHQKKDETFFLPRPSRSLLGRRCPICSKRTIKELVIGKGLMIGGNWHYYKCTDNGCGYEKAYKESNLGGIGTIA